MHAAPSPDDSAVALAVWVAGPSLVLAGVALGARLSGNWPDPPQAWGGAAVLWAQILLAGLLHARLLATWRSLVAAALLAVPPVVAATSLAQLAPSAAVEPLAWLAAWLAALHLLARRDVPAGFAALLALTPVALVVLSYLRIEADPAAGGFGPSTFLPPLPLGHFAANPTPAAARLAPFALPAAVATASPLLVILRRYPRIARRGHRLSTAAQNLPTPPE